MKKLFLLAVMAVSLLLNFAGAEEKNPRVWLEETSRTETTLVLAVKVKTYLNLGGGELEINYNPAKLEYDLSANYNPSQKFFSQDGRNSDLIVTLKKRRVNNHWENCEGILLIGASGRGIVQGIGGEGTIAVLNFKIKGDISGESVKFNTLKSNLAFGYPNGIDIPLKNVPDVGWVNYNIQPAPVICTAQ